MTVNGIETLTAPPPAGGAVAPGEAATSGDFTALLEAQRSAAATPRTLATVSLDRMISSLTGSAGMPAAQPGPVGGPSDAWGVAADGPASVPTGLRAEVLQAGERYLGVPYLWGGTDPAKGFDCSGFVQQVYQDLGISLPRVSADQARAGVEVAGGLDAAQPGDLVFWNGNGSRPNHIGIYAGEGRMLVAPRTGDVVRYQEIQRPPDAVRRVLP